MKTNNKNSFGFFDCYAIYHFLVYVKHYLSVTIFLLIIKLHCLSY